MRAANNRLKISASAARRAPSGDRPDKHGGNMVGVGGTNMAGAGAPIGPGASGWLGRTPTSRRGGRGVSEVDEPALDRRMVLLPSRNSISSTCALTCPFVVAQSRGSHDFPRVRGRYRSRRCSSLPSLDAAVPLPNCLLCKGHASPPGRMGWLSCGGDQRLFSICGVALGTATTPSSRRRSTPRSAIPTPRRRRRPLRGRLGFRRRRKHVYGS